MEERLVESVGQLLIIGFDGVEMTPRLRSLLTQVQPAGVILFARNIQNARQTWLLLDECQRCVTTPVFRCVDLEGGTVDRFRNALVPTPSAAEVFDSADSKLFRRHGELIGKNCRSLGFNVDFAPVLDLAFEASREVMSSRTVSDQPRETVSYARHFLSGLQSAKVLGCGKHFPGLGEGKLDSHHDLPVIEKPLKKLWEEDLLPYRELRRKLPFVMIAHAAYPQVTHDRKPASLSKLWITDILRRRIGYRNLVVSDDLEMGGVLAAAPVGQAAVESLRAGADVCLICHREDYIRQVHEELIKTAERDRRLAKCAREATTRVLAFKKKWASILLPARMPSPTTVEKLSRALWEFGEQVRLEALNSANRPRLRRA
jgi:beta-N-acetylhexosaminidase